MKITFKTTGDTGKFKLPAYAMYDPDLHYDHIDAVAASIQRKSKHLVMDIEQKDQEYTLHMGRKNRAGDYYSTGTLIVHLL